MTKIIQGTRIGKSAKLRVGSSAVIFDESGEKIFLTQRSDNQQWCLPGGGMDPGESISETCIREIFEETGLKVQIKRLIGVYTSPDSIIEYADGNRVQIVAFNFEVEITGGEAIVSDETLAFGYFNREEMASLDMLDIHHQRIEDAFEQRKETFIR